MGSRDLIPGPEGSIDRRGAARGVMRRAWDILFKALRGLTVLANNFYAALGIFIVAGATVAIAGTWAFTVLASNMREGATQRFDVAVLTWMSRHQVPWLETAMLEVTMLGNGAPVAAVVCVAALFLWLNRHRYSASLLLVATAGGMILTGILKTYFDRPRPRVFEWGAEVLTMSFPSGHATSSAIVYGTVAYLAARLQKKRAARCLTLTAAGIVIALIGLSRMYLGVHYPSDVVAGITIGLAWAAFCMATLEVLQILARRETREVREEVLEHEEPAPAHES
ncbi:MAG: phosphatase PAP2 family protein [Gemmatimonadaceae bacterium]